MNKVSPEDYFEACFDHGAMHMATLEEMLRATEEWEQLSQATRDAIFGSLVKSAIYEG